MSTRVPLGPRWRGAYSALSRTKLPLPTMSLSPPSEAHKFPPNELLDIRKPSVVEHWTSLQPPPNSAVVALANRMGIASIFNNGKNSIEDEENIALLMRQALTHDSFARQHQAMYPNESPPPTNGMLASLGNTLLGLFATEHINASYPHLPTRVLKAATNAYVGHQTCVNVAQELGIAPLVRWHRKAATTLKQGVTHADALSSVPRALTALIYHHRSLSVARKFAHTFFLSRTVDLKSLIKFRDPKLALSFTVEHFGRERPISRLLRESGRNSNSPIFVVGIFSGVDKLGEGFGSSLKMAEYRAAEDALHRLYLTRVPQDLVALPTSSFPQPLPKQTKSVFDFESPSQPGERYVPFQFPNFASAASTFSAGSSSAMDGDSADKGSPSNSNLTTIGQSEILYGLNDRKDVNVVEDLKRPWWRPSTTHPSTSKDAKRVLSISRPKSVEEDDARAKNERKRERSIATDGWKRQEKRAWRKRRTLRREGRRS